MIELPSNASSTSLKRAGPSVASRMIRGFHLPLIPRNSISVGRTSSFPAVVNFF
jgi:hypothetical protein